MVRQLKANCEAGYMVVKFRDKRLYIKARRPQSHRLFQNRLPDVVHDGDLCFIIVILSILLWILMAIVFAIVLWIFSNVLVIVIMTFVAMLYWVFFRALRLVFKNSNKSKGDLMESIKWGLTYTILYNFWIYGIFILTTYFKG